MYVFCLVCQFVQRMQLLGQLCRLSSQGCVTSPRRRSSLLAMVLVAHSIADHFTSDNSLLRIYILHQLPSNFRNDLYICKLESAISRFYSYLIISKSAQSYIDIDTIHIIFCMRCRVHKMTSCPYDVIHLQCTSLTKSSLMSIYVVDIALIDWRFYSLFSTISRPIDHEWRRWSKSLRYEWNVLMTIQNRCIFLAVRFRLHSSSICVCGAKWYTTINAYGRPASLLSSEESPACKIWAELPEHLPLQN